MIWFTAVNILRSQSWEVPVVRLACRAVLQEELEKTSGRTVVGSLMVWCLLLWEQSLWCKAGAHLREKWMTENSVKPGTLCALV